MKKNEIIEMEKETKLEDQYIGLASQEKRHVIAKEIEYEDGEKLICPAIIGGQIATPDNKIFIVNSPFENFARYLETQQLPDKSTTSRSWLLNNIFSNRINSCIRENIITAFNMLNNPIGEGDNALLHVNGHSIYDNPGVVCFTNEPSRVPVELFTQRSTLDDILNSYLYSFSFNFENITEQLMFEYSVFVISTIYDICLKHIDCEKDVVNFNRFIGNLSATLPMSMNYLYREWKNSYKQQYESEIKLSNKNDYFNYELD